MADSNGSPPQTVPQRDSSLPSEKSPEHVANAAISASEDLTPEQKRAQAEDSIQHTGLSEAFSKSQEKHRTGHLATDLGTSDTAQVMQALASANAKPVAEAKQASEPSSAVTPSSSTDKTPGSFPPAKVGWTAFSTLPNPGDEKTMESLKETFSTDALVDMFKGSRNSDGSETLSNDLLAQYLNESYYGEWYHNAGVMVFSVVFTWLLTKLGGGLMMCLVVGAFLGK